RGFCWRRQRLGAARMEKASAADVLAETGWARTVGGTTPYLALRARARHARATVDADLAANRICELPAARGCAYLVPAADYAIALQAGAGGPEAEIAQAKKHLGVTDKEVDKLGAAVVAAVGRGPLDPRELKDELGALVRNLGEAGKKRGMTTTLPLVLGRLQSQGEIRPVPTNGRLDQQRYRYRRWTPSPLGKSRLGAAELAVELARRYFRWAAPATAAQFGWWSALSVKDRKTAVAALGLVPLAAGDERLVFPEDRDAIPDFRAPSRPELAFLGNLDNLVHQRRDAGALADASDAKREVWTEKGGQKVGSVLDLEHHAILDRGRLVGVWEYDFERHELVWATFGKIPGISKVADEVSRLIGDDLGDVRSFSLDSPESRGPRLKAIRGLTKPSCLLTLGCQTPKPWWSS